MIRSRRAVPRDAQRLAGHDRIVLVRPLVEFLDHCPRTRACNVGTRCTRTARREPLVIHRRSCHSAVLQLPSRRTASAVATTCNRIRAATPVSRSGRGLPSGAPRRGHWPGLQLAAGPPPRPPPNPPPRRAAVSVQLGGVSVGLIAALMLAGTGTTTCVCCRFPSPSSRDVAGQRCRSSFRSSGRRRTPRPD